MSEMQEPGSSTNGHAGESASGGESKGSSGTGPADETFGWTGEDQASGAAADAKAAAERMLSQLQAMIDSIATQAAPVVRQVGAKAAELAAVAADRAGPLAHRAADATAEASVRLAERSRTWAAELRSHVDDSDHDGAAGATGDPESASRASVAVEGATDAEERSAEDDPAEGPRT
jgi:hypothetical protein